eukprot:CCRYP_009043-RA/>CCRYP_009043-RA protein AED:0.61 eAED:0.67 QI:0/0/0/1/0/0/2/0/71
MLRKITKYGNIEIVNIIRAIERSHITKEEDLFKAVGQFEPGDVVAVTLTGPQVKVDIEESPEIVSENSYFL